MKSKKLKITLSIILIIVWLLVIYNFSSMDNTGTNGLSKKLIFKIVDLTTNYSYTETMNIVNTINKPIRKCAHMFEFCVLNIILFASIINIKDDNYKKILLITTLTCFMYAGLDEFHQLFVFGRTGQFSDVVIDTIGAIIGCFIINKTIQKSDKENHEIIV